MYNLLSGANTKTDKGKEYGYLTVTLQLMPNRTSGYNVCPAATKECIASCNAFSGFYARIDSARRAIHSARIDRTRLYFEDKVLFNALLLADIYKAKKKADKQRLKLAVRLNCFSDIDFTDMIITATNRVSDDIVFYDYTKMINHISKANNLKKDHDINYHLTFSWSGTNEHNVRAAIKNGNNVAVPFYPILPQKFMGYPVIDGDIHDLRFLDPQNCIVGLRFKKSRLPNGNKGQPLSPFIVLIDN